MKVGLIGFGKTGKAVASVLLQSPETKLQWVVRQSHTLEHCLPKKEIKTVRLRHESISREAFGNGVLFAAQHLQDKPNGLYTMEDLLPPYFQLDATTFERRSNSA